MGVRDEDAIQLNKIQPSVSPMAMSGETTDPSVDAHVEVLGRLAGEFAELQLGEDAVTGGVVAGAVEAHHALRDGQRAVGVLLRQGCGTVRRRPSTR